MTTVGFPYNAEEYAAQEARQALSMYLPGASSARPLGSTSGVRVGTPTDTISVSGSTVTIKPHSGVLDKHTAATAGPYLYAVTANETKTLNAAHATYARIDIITVKVDDPSTSDGSSVPAVVIGYKAGTASASPAAPTPDSTREMVLANINVPASGGGSATVTWKAPTVSAAGAPYYWLSQAQQDAQTGMVTGEIGFRASNGWRYIYTGSAWVVSSTGVSPTSLTLDTGVTASQNLVAKEGRVVTVTVTATRAAGWPTDTEVGTLPSGFRPSATIYSDALTFGTGSVVGSQITSAGVISLVGPPSGHTVAGLTITFVASE